MSGRRSFTAACLQLNAGDDMAANIETISAFIRSAREQGADMVFLPENAMMMTWGRRALLDAAFPEDRHPGLLAMKALAVDLKLWIHCGTVHVHRDDEHLANRTIVFDPDGAVAARYDKIHMFDVALPGGETYRESAVFAPGDKAVIVDLPWGRLGLSVCYDLRFPALFRALAQAGAEILTIPAAFTRTTGQAHWHILQRARAIENGCFVLAPAQTGDHAAGRQTYGHALIVDPWGEVLADAGESPGFVLAEIDVGRVGEIRARLPSLRHDREFSFSSE